MSRPPCYYCDGTGWLEDAVRIDVDDYRDAECGWCEGTGKAMHSANTRTYYRFVDPLDSLKRMRRHAHGTLRRIRADGLAAVDNGFDPYLNVKRHAIGQPVLHTLAQRESDLRVVSIYRDMLAAQARAAA